MSLKGKYQQFLASPTSAALADNASINYITTLTTINEPAAIIRHLSAQAKTLSKKSETVIGTVEGQNDLCVDVETVLEFVSGGGAYLPGLDDNFLADRLVTFPVVHIIQFDHHQKIRSIRLYWDQGSLLKQVEIIGARARNWPIRDGRDQARLIASTSASSQSESAVSSRRTTVSRDESSAAARSHSSSISATGDPHASLSLFQPREAIEEDTYKPQAIAPRATSARPPPREYSELFAGEETSASTAQSQSPRKNGIPVKAGGGKNFRPSRLFEEENEFRSPDRSIKTYENKYNHFDLGGDDNSTPKARPTSRSTKNAKHQSQWNFEDFVTPEKAPAKVRGQDVRHFGWSDDEDTSPVRRPIVHQPRPSADTHFDFVDDGTPAAQKTKHFTAKGRMHNKGLGLYQDHVVGNNDDESEGDTKKPLGNASTNIGINNDSRKKDFGSQWAMTDNSPTGGRNDQNGRGSISEDRQKVLNGLNANWGPYEQSPDRAQERKENVPGQRGINIGGNGMGGRKGTAASWTLGDEEDDVAASKPVSRTKKTEASKGFWDF